MKNHSLLVMSALLLAACQHTDKPATATESTARSPIEGAWEVVENRVDGKVTKPNRPWVGYSDQQTWELRDDTLIFSGFKKMFDRTGKEMPSDTWGGDKFVEKRVRAKP